MNLRSFVMGVLTVCVVFATEPAGAQFRRFGGTTRVPKRPASRPNANHERAKTEAENSYQKGDYERSERLMSTVIRENQRDHVAYYLRASARVELGRQRGDGKLIRSGISDAREALRIDGTKNVLYYLPYLYGMTQLTSLENRDEHAKISVQIASQVLGRSGLKPDQRANLRYQRAAAQMALRDYKKAVADYAEATRISPAHLGAWMGLAEAYAADGQKEKALDSYARMVKAFPDNTLVYNNRGMYLQKNGDSAAAVADFTRAIELNSNYFYAYTNRGFALLQSGDAEAAENDFTTSLKINPNQTTVYGMRGSSRLAQGKLQEAVEDHTTAVRLVPENASAHADLGFALYFSGDLGGAEKSFEQALKLDKSLRYLNPWRFWVLHRSGNNNGAKKIAAESLAKKSELRDWVDQLLVFLGDEISEQELVAAVDDESEQMKRAQLCEANFFIGLRKAEAGDQDAARENFERALKSNAKHLSAYRGAQFAMRKFSSADTDAGAAGSGGIPNN